QAALEQLVAADDVPAAPAAPPTAPETTDSQGTDGSEAAARELEPSSAENENSAPEVDAAPESAPELDAAPRPSPNPKRSEHGADWIIYALAAAVLALSAASLIWLFGSN
ncbi:MAG: hypothetical protein GXP55_10610, partial [Deltaproteobacteria bacterium]|nr:hypothetical protein [Deltaproteobacteria bacterium]